FFITPVPPASPPLPYTTLFRSADDAVEHVAAGDELDGVGDHVAANQRCLHAFGAHGDAVGDGDGVELHGSTAGGADAFLDLHGRSEEHTSELQSREKLVCRLLL